MVIENILTMDKLIKQKAHELLGKHCPNGISIEGVIGAIIEGIETSPKELDEQEDTSVYECLFFDEAQGRYLCTNHGTDFKKCIDVKCGFFNQK